MLRRGGFDLVIIDHDLPQLDGQQLAVAIKAVAPATPVLMISADPRDDDGEAPAAVDFFVAKPFALVQLREVVKAILWTRPAAPPPLLIW